MISRDSQNGLAAGVGGCVRILNFGSLNIDHVYRVRRISRPGETVDSLSYQVSAGGKGANQSAALGRAGAPVSHAGLVGGDGGWLIDKLKSCGVDMRHADRLDEAATGQAFIQVDADGQNSIVLHGGCNRLISKERIDDVLSHFHRGDILLLQNEISETSYLINEASRRAMRTILNPAPFTPEVLSYPLEHVDTVIVNETEAAELIAGMARSPMADSALDPDASGPAAEQLDELSELLPNADLVLTLGAGGVQFRSRGGHQLRVAAAPADVVDTTAAGDTFVGYFVAALSAGMQVDAALRRASVAAALSVGLPGAMDSIPTADAVDAREAELRREG